MPDEDGTDDRRTLTETTEPVFTTVIYEYTIPHPPPGSGLSGFHGFSGFGAFGPTRSGSLPAPGIEPPPSPTPDSSTGTGRPVGTGEPSTPTGESRATSAEPTTETSTTAPAPTTAPSPSPGTSHASPARAGLHSIVFGETVHGPLVTFKAGRARTDAERVLEDRLGRGEGTPEEALHWFQTHGMAGLTGLPSWNGVIWLFPGAVAPGSSGSLEPWLPHVGAPLTGSGGGSGGGAPPPGGRIGLPRGEGVGTRSHGVAAGIGVAVPEPPPEPTDGGFPGGRPPRTPLAPGTSLGPRDLLPLPAPQSHFAHDQVEGAVRDIMDRQNPWLARLVLFHLLPAAYVAALLEGQVLNPFLAAPWELYAAGVAGLRSAEAVARGDWRTAVENDHKAAEHLVKGAGAILAVLPIGEGVTATKTAARRLAGTGVEFRGIRWLSREEGVAHVLHQEWITGSPFEHRFLIDGTRELLVDGFAHKGGLGYVDRASNVVLVEVKMPSAVERILRDANYAHNSFRQLTNYVTLNERLGAGGVMYVITEATEGTPLTQLFRQLLREHFPQQVESGALQVVDRPPPPASFTGLSWPQPGVLEATFAP